MEKVIELKVLFYDSNNNNFTVKFGVYEGEVKYLILITEVSANVALTMSNLLLFFSVAQKIVYIR